MLTAVAAQIAGKKDNSSPIIEAIRLAEAESSGEIRVHLSQKWFEKDPFGRALKIFEKYGMHKTSAHNAVLIYINLRRNKFAIIGDEGISRALGQPQWDQLGRELQENLRSTQRERAISLVVRSIGELLKKHFPKDLS